MKHTTDCYLSCSICGPPCNNNLPFLSQGLVYCTLTFVYHLSNRHIPSHLRSGTLDLYQILTISFYVWCLFWHPLYSRALIPDDILFVERRLRKVGYPCITQLCGDWGGLSSGCSPPHWGWSLPYPLRCADWGCFSRHSASCLWLQRGLSFQRALGYCWGTTSGWPHWSFPCAYPWQQSLAKAICD